MDRHFTLPIAIAAALHGLLLGLPGNHPPAKPSAPIAGDPLPPSPTIPLVDNVADSSDDKTVNQPSGGGEDLPRGVEVPTADNGAAFHVAVERTTNRVSAGELMRITGPIGPGTGIGDGPPGIISSVALDRPPHARVQIAPQYPPPARADGRSGEVTMEFVVDETGYVLNPRIVSSTDSVFNEAAIRAIVKWRFEPGTVHGVPVRFRMALPVVFHLDE